MAFLKKILAKKNTNLLPAFYFQTHVTLPAFCPKITRNMGVFYAKMSRLIMTFA